MRVIIGLGNPGAQYLMTRHNIGFMMVDALAYSYQFSSFKRWHNVSMSEGIILSKKIFLLKPMTFMNCSGSAVTDFISFYKIPLEDILVVHDDLDLELGQIKIKQGGGSGGHNGLKNLDSHIGQNYWRLRLGIGHPGSALQVSNYVLQNFSPQEKDQLLPLVEIITQEIPFLLEKDKSIFLNNIKSRY